MLKEHRQPGFSAEAADRSSHAAPPAKAKTFTLTEHRPSALSSATGGRGCPLVTAWSRTLADYTGRAITEPRPCAGNPRSTWTLTDYSDGAGWRQREFESSPPSKNLALPVSAGEPRLCPSHVPTIESSTLKLGLPASSRALILSSR